jgi:hypothetical protein
VQQLRPSLPKRAAVFFSNLVSARARLARELLVDSLLDRMASSLFFTGCSLIDQLFPDVCKKLPKAFALSAKAPSALNAGSL